MPQKRAWFIKLVPFLVLGAVVVVLVVGVDGLSRGDWASNFELWVNNLGSRYRQWFKQQDTGNLLFLLPLSFAGGLVASVSPCILSLLPINLGYIGTREVTCRRDALVRATAFVLGVVLVLSLLGLFSSVAAVVLIQFRGYFYILVGSIIVLMGLGLMGILHLPLPQLGWLPLPSSSDTSKTGSWHSALLEPFSVGLTFALVSSPCTSPVMFAVLTAAAATGSQIQSVLAMVCYALGYTMLIFLASLFAGLAKRSRLLLKHSETVIRMCSIALLLLGGFYMVNGIRWVIASLLLG